MSKPFLSLCIAAAALAAFHTSSPQHRRIERRDPRIVAANAQPNAATAVTAGGHARSQPLPPALAFMQPGVFQMPACVAGSGRDFRVGPGQPYTELDQVPWDTLAAGDTVRIFHRPAAYRGKILIAAVGTATAPVRVCGIKSQVGERPVIDGENAVARRGLSYTAASQANIQETRSLIMIDRLGTQDWATAAPAYIQVDGLELRGQHPRNTFTNSLGAVQNYVEFGACIWIERGRNIVIADNVVHDCTNGIFSKSVDYADALITRNLRLAGNHIFDNGVVGVESIHNTYIQTVGVVYEFNTYGPLRPGATGNALKDRSVGATIRYNRIEEGAHAIDLVEAEDYTSVANADPTYRLAYVYGNQIVKTGDTGTFIHYGGDHYGCYPGCSEANFRKGTLYFWNNTVIANGKSAALFQLSTTEETAEVWNNVFVFANTVTYPSMRQSSEVTSPWVPGGVLHLGTNWINGNWADSDPWHPVPGTLSGAANLVTGTASPVDLQTLVPLAGGAAIDASQTDLAGVSAHPLQFQLAPRGIGVVRTTHGTKRDLGAVER